jgi:hypothetical protein
VVNGCGGGDASTDPRLGDKHWFVEPSTRAVYKVNFRLACNSHDAAYSGAKVFDPFLGAEVDYFGWSRDRIDKKFLADMRTLCDRAIPEEARAARAQCHGRGSASADSESCLTNLLTADMAGAQCCTTACTTGATCSTGRDPT